MRRPFFQDGGAELVNLIPEGVSVAAVVAVVVIMLKHNREQRAEGRTLFEAAMSRVETMGAQSRESTTQIQQTFMVALDRMMIQHGRIEDQHAAVLSRVVDGLGKLEMAVQALSSRLNRDRDK